MFGTISAAYKIWTALEGAQMSSSTQEYAAAEAMLMTGEPQSVADVVLVLRTLARRLPNGEAGADLNRRRLLQMCDCLDADLEAPQAMASR